MNKMSSDLRVVAKFLPMGWLTAVRTLITATETSLATNETLVGHKGRWQADSTLKMVTWLLNPLHCAQEISFEQIPRFVRQVFPKSCALKQVTPRLTIQLVANMTCPNLLKPRVLVAEPLLMQGQVTDIFNSWNWATFNKKIWQKNSGISPQLTASFDSHCAAADNCVSLIRTLGITDKVRLKTYHTFLATKQMLEYSSSKAHT